MKAQDKLLPFAGSHEVEAPVGTWDVELRLRAQAQTKDRVRCHLQGPGQDGRELWFFHVLSLPPEVAAQVTPYAGPLRAGDPYECVEPLPPGPISLRLEAEGLEPLDLRLVLEAGQIHEQTVRLVPR